MRNSQVVTRFAPSPTGYLHAGGARTALFCWAFARGHKGKFILRLEDTDRKRSTDRAAAQIFEDLRWLGIDWDEGPIPDAGNSCSEYLTKQIGDNGPYCQSQRLNIYDRYVDQLIESGYAYECQSDSSGSGRSKLVRFRYPDHAVTVVDEILGSVTVEPGELKDFVIRKSDGYATYHLAVVVDDYLMGVTHVFRAQEHLSNTPKHWALQDALGFPHPTYAHFPLIFNPAGKKMSKREKPRSARKAVHAWIEKNNDLEQLAKRCSISSDDLSAFVEGHADSIPVAEAISKELNVKLPEIDVHDFRKSGYLPEVLCNYLCLLGWSPPDGIEAFEKQSFVKHFDLSRAGKSSARFDPKKLIRFNADKIRSLSRDEFASLLFDFGSEFHSEFTTKLSREKFVDVASVYQNRTRVLTDVFSQANFLVVPDDDLHYEPAVFSDVILENGCEGAASLKLVVVAFESIENWQRHEIEEMVDSLSQNADIDKRIMLTAIRFAITGSKSSPSIGDTCVLLGKRAVLARIDSCLKRVREKSPQFNGNNKCHPPL